MTTKGAPQVFSKPDEDVWEVYLPLAPVPASRPRVSRWGTYYQKTYQTWKAEAATLLRPYWNTEAPTRDPLFASVHFVCKRPATPSKTYPRGDVDNYTKAALDVVTTSQAVWNDDAQIVCLWSTKRYANKGETPHTFLRISTDEHKLFSEGCEDVYDLPSSWRVPYEES